MSEYYQGNKSIQEYYSSFISLWSEYLGLVYNNITKTESPTLQKFHKDGQLDWFLVKLRKEFENVQSNLQDQGIWELLREKQHCITQEAMEQGVLTIVPNVVYAI